VSTSPGPDGRERPSTGRRDARERALELLYEAQAKSSSVDDVLAELPVEPDPYAVALATGVEAHRIDIDALLARHVREDWTLDRMPIVDLTLLRLATHELVHEPGIPVAVVISEAVALAKQFSTDDAGRFINGVLGAVAAEVRGGPAAP
jgi:N utilization substance protein B